MESRRNGVKKKKREKSITSLHVTENNKIGKEKPEIFKVRENVHETEFKKNTQLGGKPEGNMQNAP